jgi:NADPH:quinone reductase-like Zn-dependent oxidoreductase
MRVMQVEGQWGLKNIRRATRPKPRPRADEILVQIGAVSINPRDRVMVDGGYGQRGGQLPLVPLCDGAGYVIEAGDNVTLFKVGDLVIPSYSRSWLSGTFESRFFSGAHGGPLDGMMQEYITIPENAVTLAPKNFLVQDAATLPCAAVTAWNALMVQAKITAKRSVLIQGTGGVSMFALQIAKAVGAETIVLSGSEQKLERAKTIGADHTLNYKKYPDWERLVREMFPDGVDHIIDIGGASTIDRAIRAVKPSGSISLIGVLGGIKSELDLARVVTRNVRLQGVTVGSLEMLNGLCKFLEDSKIFPIIDHTKTFAFDAVATALDDQQKGEHFGKIISVF